MTEVLIRFVAEVRTRLMPTDGYREWQQAYLVRCPRDDCGDDANFLLDRADGSGRCLNERLESGYRRYSSREVAGLVGIERLGRATGALLNLHEAWGEVVSVTADIPEVAAAAALSARVSRKLGTGLVWLLIVGRPSSGKTECVMALKGIPETYYLDTLTVNSFISGFGAGANELLNELEDRILVVKDMSSLFTLMEDTVSKIFGDMCAIYDGSFSRFTGTRGHVTYETGFPFIGCVTPRVVEQHQRRMNLIGPRFLFLRIPSLSSEEKAKGREIAWDSSDRDAKLKRLAEAMEQVVIPLLQVPVPDILIDDTGRSYLNTLADFLASGRAVVSYANDGTGNYDPADIQKEEPWRALGQLRTVTFTLAWLHGRKQVTEHELELARRVVLSTMPPARTELLYLFHGKTQEVTRKICMAATGKSERRVNQVLTELKMAGILEMKYKVGKEEYFGPVSEFDAILRAPMEPLDHVGDLLGEIW